MPFTKRQINRILDEQGRPVITLGRSDHLALRVAESYLRRKLYAWEDRAVTAQWDTFDRAYQDVRTFATKEAEARHLDTLARNRQSMVWRDAVKQYARYRLKQAMDATAVEGFRYALTAWYAGYYGGAWELDVMTTPETRVKVPRPQNYQAHADVLLPRLQEAALPDEVLWSLMGADFRAQHALELDEMLIRVSRVLDSGVNQGLNQDIIFRSVREAMGIETNRALGFTKNFHKVQTITRTAVMNAANEGNMTLYRANADLVGQVEWLAAHDGRVCPYCQSLDGTRWPLGDPSLKVPPMDSHPNCRCTIIPILSAEGALVDSDSAPSMTLGEWLLALGAGWFLSDFLDMELASTQV